VRNCYLELFL